MSSLGDSPVPLRHSRDRKGKDRITLATSWWPIQLDSGQARRLSAALSEWASTSDAGAPHEHGTEWEASPETRKRWRRVELLTRVGLIGAILLVITAIGTTAVASSTSTDISLNYEVSGGNSSVWLVSLCQNHTVTLRGGGQSWDCSLVLFNNAFETHVLDGVTVQNARLTGSAAWPLVVPPLNFVPLTIVGDTPYFGGTQNVTITISVGP